MILSWTFNSPTYCESANIFAEALDDSSIYKRIYDVGGRIIGLKFKESGQTGSNISDSSFWWIIGPFKDMLLPVDPKAVEITIPSPHKGANNIKSFS